MDPITLPTTSKAEARQRVAEIACDSTGFVFIHDHCELRMAERGVTRRQVMQVLRTGELVGKVRWDTKEERGWKMTLTRISAGAEIVVGAKLIERNEECVLALTTFEKF